MVAMMAWDGIWSLALAVASKLHAPPPVIYWLAGILKFGTWIVMLDFMFTEYRRDWRERRERGEF